MLIYSVKCNMCYVRFCTKIKFTIIIFLSKHTHFLLIICSILHNLNAKLLGQIIYDFCKLRTNYSTDISIPNILYINISRLFFNRVWKISSHGSTPPRRSPVQNVTRVKFLRSYDARQKNPVSGIVDRLSIVYGASGRERNCFQRKSHRKNRFR